MCGEIRSLVLKCPECAAEMEILADGIPRYTCVSCSRCGSELGSWGRLAEGHSPDGTRSAERDRSQFRQDDRAGGPAWSLSLVADVPSS